MSREETKQILSELHEVSGVSGREYKVGEKMKELLSGCYDEFTVDALGNYIFKKKGITGKKKIMLSAHMDEIGFIVSDIWDNGYVSFLQIGRASCRERV